MKAFIKTVALTLVISVTALFFSSYKKVEAAAAGATVAAGAAIAAIGSLIISAAAYFADALPNVDVAGIISHTEFKESISVSEDGTAAYAPPSIPYVNINEKAWAAFNTLAEESTKEYNSSLRVYVCGGSGGDPGNNGKIPGDAFNAALKGTILGALGCGIVEWAEDVLGGTDPSGAAAGITMGITTVNGKPQKVTTTYAESTVEVFDYLGLDYQMFNSLEDVFFDCSVTRTYEYYRPFIITSDNKLYTFVNQIVLSYKIGSYSSAWIEFEGVSGRFSVSTNGENDTYRAFRFYIKDGILGVAFYSSNVDTYGRLNRGQFIVSNPSLNTYPVLFSDKLSYTTINSTDFQNYAVNFNLCRVSDKTPIGANDIMSLDIACVGCFKGSSSQNTSSGSATLKTASNMLAGTESIVQGGTNTTYSELSDIEKAIYALAKQQGITYEEMLEQSNLVVENGQIYLEGLDGVTHSIESLLSEFEKLLEQGSISNEQGAATVEQLTELLAYIKSLNIEGTNEYISKIEAALDSLNQRDEDQSALLGDVVGTLQEMKEFLSSLGINSISEDIKSISTALSEARAKEIASNDLQKKMEEDIYAAIPFNNNFKLYNQCKYFIETVFNYDDVLSPPNFSFYWDSDGDGESELYNPFDISFLETKLTGENLVDKSWFPVEIKVIDLIRYVIAIVIYGFFVMRLIKRLPTFYGSGPWAQL